MPPSLLEKPETSELPAMASEPQMHAMKSSRGFLSSLAKGTHSRVLRSVLAASSLIGTSAIEPQKTSADNKVVASFAPAITYDNPAQLIKDGLRPPPHDYELLDPNFPNAVMGNTKDGWWVVIYQDGTVLRWRDKVKIGQLDPRITQSVETVKKHLFQLQPLPPLETVDVEKEFYAEQAKMPEPAATYDNPAQLIKDGLRPPPHDYELLDPNFPNAVMGNTKDGWWVVIYQDGTVLRWRDKVKIGQLDPRITQSVETVKKYLFQLQPLPALEAAAPAPSATENVRPYDDFNALRAEYKWRAPNNNGYTAQGYANCFWVQDDQDRWYMFERDGTVFCENTKRVVGHVDPRAVESIEAVKKYILGGQQLPPLPQAAAPVQAAANAAVAHVTATPEKQVSYDDADAFFKKIGATSPTANPNDPNTVWYRDQNGRQIKTTNDGVTSIFSTGEIIAHLNPAIFSSITEKIIASKAYVEAPVPQYDDYYQIRELVQPPEDLSWGQAQFPGMVMVQTRNKLWVTIDQKTGVMTRVRDGQIIGRIDPRIAQSAQTVQRILFGDEKLPPLGEPVPIYETLDLGTQASGHAFDEDLKMGIWNMFPQIKINAAAANRSDDIRRSAEEAFRKAPELIGLMAKAAYYEAYKEKTGGGPASVDAIHRAISTYRYAAEVGEFVQGIPSAKEILDLLRKPEVFNTYYKIYSGKAAAERATTATIQAMVQKAAHKAASSIPSDSSLHLLELNKDTLIKAWDDQGLDGKAVHKYRMLGFNQEEAIAMSKGLQTAQNGAPKIANDFSGTLVAGPTSPDTQMAINESNKQIAEQELDKTPQPEDRIYKLSPIIDELIEPLNVELDAKGNVIVNFELQNETKMYNVWVQPTDISAAGTTSRPNLSLTLEGKNLPTPYTSFKSFSSAESISAPLPPGKYTLRISDVMTYYLNSAKNAHYKFQIGFNIKKFDSRNIEGMVTREDHPKAMKISMHKTGFRKNSEGQLKRIPFEELDPVDNKLQTWLVIHGRNSNHLSGKMSELSQAISECGFQVIECDWEEGASDNSLLTLQPLAGKKWIEKSADKYFQLLKFMEFSGDKIINGVHSWGTPMGYEIAERFRQENGFGVQGFVALDAAQDPAELLGLTEKQLDISAICKSSESFYGSQWGSALRTLRSHKSSMIISQPRLTANEMHADVVTAFANLLRLQKIEKNEVGAHYQISELLKDKRLVPCKDYLDNWIWVNCDQVKEGETGDRYRNAKPYQLTTSNPFDDNEDDPLYNSDLSLLD